jgi:predicted lipoprotein with Yx(FWY)xxD motif
MVHAFRALGTRIGMAGIALTIVVCGVVRPGTAAAQNDPSVNVRTSGAFGALLTDPDGWALYMWAGDEPGESNCYDACADEWPPYTIDSSPVAPPGFPGALSLIDRGDGTWQVTLDDMPLYYFAGDNSPGDANGQGSFDFGAPWHIVAFGPPAAAAPPSFGTPQIAAPGQPQAPPGAMQAPPPGSAVRPGAQGQPFPPPGYTGPAVQQFPPGYSYPQPGYAYAQPGYPYAQQPSIAPAYAPGPGYGSGQTLTIQAPPNGVVSLSWIATPNASSYRIYQTLSTQPLNFSVAQTIQQPTGQLVTNALVAGLAPGATYFVQVRAVSPSGLETVTPASVFSSPSLGR